MLVLLHYILRRGSVCEARLAVLRCVLHLKEACFAFIPSEPCKRGISLLSCSPGRTTLFPLLSCLCFAPPLCSLSLPLAACKPAASLPLMLLTPEKQQQQRCYCLLPISSSSFQLVRMCKGDGESLERDGTMTIRHRAQMRKTERDIYL